MRRPGAAADAAAGRAGRAPPGGDRTWLPVRGGMDAPVPRAADRPPARAAPAAAPGRPPVPRAPTPHRKHRAYASPLARESATGAGRVPIGADSRRGRRTDAAVDAARGGSTRPHRPRFAACGLTCAVAPARRRRHPSGRRAPGVAAAHPAGRTPAMRTDPARSRPISPPHAHSTDHAAVGRSPRRMANTGRGAPRPGIDPGSTRAGWAGSSARGPVRCGFPWAVCAVHQ